MVAKKKQQGSIFFGATSGYHRLVYSLLTDWGKILILIPKVYDFGGVPQQLRSGRHCCGGTGWRWGSGERRKAEGIPHPACMV
jgi:hypothetical protein